GVDFEGIWPDMDAPSKSDRRDSSRAAAAVGRFGPNIGACILNKPALMQYDRIFTAVRMPRRACNSASGDLYLGRIGQQGFWISNDLGTEKVQYGDIGCSLRFRGRRLAPGKRQPPHLGR